MAHRYEEIAELLGYPSERTAVVARKESNRQDAGDAKKNGAIESEPAIGLGAVGALAVDPRNSEARRGFAGFAEYVAGRDLRELEELYTSTFDIQGNVCLDVGYQLFGETYKRGQFIVKLRVALREAGVSEAGELPDHLPSVLRFLAKREEEEEKENMHHTRERSRGPRQVCWEGERSKLVSRQCRVGTENTEEDTEEKSNEKTEERGTGAGAVAETRAGAGAGADAVAVAGDGKYPGDAEELVREAVLPAIVKMIDAFGSKENPYRALLEATKAVLQADFGVAEIPAAPDADRGAKSFLPPGASGRFSLPVAQDYDVDEEGFEQRGFRP